MTDDRSATARALVALELVQRRPGITADQLADALGVSARAVRRYVQVLREADIPVVSERGPYGGYRLGRGLRPPPLLFTAAEALGLVMAVLDGHHDTGDATDPVGGALRKVVQSLPEQVAGPALAVLRAAAPAPDRGAARPDPGTAAALVQACVDRHPVRLAYRSAAGADLDLVVEPWAVVVRHARWYLLCHDRGADARRAYRVDRVRAVEPLAGTTASPADLDAVAELETHLAVGWEHDVEVLLDAPLEEVAGWLPAAAGRLERRGADACRLLGSTSTPDAYAAALAAVPVPYRVVGGPELRAAVRAVADRMRAAVDPPA